jgi:hypothetical protein
MPHFEITQVNMLDQLSEKIPAEELGVTDLVLYGGDRIQQHELSGRL